MNYDSFFNAQLAQLKNEGRYRVFANLERLVGKSPEAVWHTPGGESKPVVVWCSNDYLGMSHNSSVLDAFQEAAQTYGVGAGGTRNIAGTSHCHVELESTLANWHNKESALLFSSGYVANEAALCALGAGLEGCVFFSDEKNHASMIQGIRHSGAKRHILKHNDMADLEAQLKQYPFSTPKVIAVISVYSMDGDIAPLSDIITLAKKYNALTYVDEVHAVGIYGPTGAGIAERDNLAKEVDIIQGNFAKAIGVVGGYIAGNANLVDFVRSFASGFIFTTSLPPAVAAAAKASIDYLKKGAALRAKLHENVAYLKNALTRNGVRFIQSPSHIIPIVIGNAFHCKQITDALLSDFGHYAQPINYPTVPRGQERLRITVSPHHTPAHMDDFAGALAYLIKTTTTLAA